MLFWQIRGDSRGLCSSIRAGIRRMTTGAVQKGAYKYRCIGAFGMADVMFVKLNLGRVEVSTCKISVFS